MAPPPPPGPRDLRDLRDLTLDERAAVAPVRTGPMVYDARRAADRALARFHETWTRYGSVTPTLYAIGDRSPGVYVPLGLLRARWGVREATVDALWELLEARHGAEGFLLALAGAGGLGFEAGDPLRPLLVLRGHHHGEEVSGALDLTLGAPWEGPARTELEAGPEAWEAAWREATSAYPLPRG